MTKQILFRMDNELLQQLTEKLQGKGLTKQFFFNRVTELFIEGKISLYGTIDDKEQTRRDDFDYLKDAILNDTDFVSALSEKLSLLSEPYIIGGDDVISSFADDLASEVSGTIENKDFNPRRNGLGNNERNDRVILPETTDLKGSTGAEIDSACDCTIPENNPLNGACNGSTVPDYVIEKLRSLPHKISNSALEKALGIPSTY
ncbi:MAG: hypothetical protein D6822_06960, partial [Cyanobacteria bacterium J149]